MVLADVKEKFVNLDARLKVGIFLAMISFFTFFSSSKDVAVAVGGYWITCADFKKNNTSSYNFIQSYF